MDDRIAALEAAVDDLRREVDRLKRTRGRSMRETHRCPACGGGRVLRFREIKDLAHAGTVDLSLQKEYSSWWGLRRSSGHLEAYACRACRLVEWHAATLDDIEVDGEIVVELVAEDAPVPETAPYR